MSSVGNKWHFEKRKWSTTKAKEDKDEGLEIYFFIKNIFVIYWIYLIIFFNYRETERKQFLCY